MADVSAQIAALETLAGRTLSAAEKETLAPLIIARNDVEIAKVISVGRTHYEPTQIGPGTVIAVMGERGGDFLDAVTNLGLTDRMVYWGMDPVKRGALDLSVPAAVASLKSLKAKMPMFVAEIDKLLKVGLVTNEVAYGTVSEVLNKVEGRAMLNE